MINFDHHGDGFPVYVLAEDAKSPISGWTNVASESALLKLLAYYSCFDMECEKASLRHWGRGSAWCEPEPGLKDLLAKASWLRLAAEYDPADFLARCSWVRVGSSPRATSSRFLPHRRSYPLVSFETQLSPEPSRAARKQIIPGQAL
jgi:hypothetical protein